MEGDGEVTPETTPTKKLKISESPFKEEWEVCYFFIHHNNAVKCLVCGSVISCIRKASLERHYNKQHQEQYGGLVGPERVEEVRVLKEKNLQEDTSQADDASCDNLTLKASYKAALRLARVGKPFADGDLMKDIVLDLVETLHPTLVRAYKKIPLSRATVTRRIADMGEDLYEQLKAKAAKFLAFSLALDESTDISDIAQLVIFIRGVDERLNVTEELLDLVPMKGTTRCRGILDAVVTAAENLGLDWQGLASVTTDGAPAMRGKIEGFLGLLRKKLIRPDLPFIHCYPHQENLCAKALPFPEVMKVVVEIVNYIRFHALNHKQFKELLAEVEAQYSDIPYHTEVRFLSKGKVCARFLELRGLIATFLKSKGREEPLLEDPEWIYDLAFLVDVFGYLNELSVKLQRSDALITDMVAKIKAFRAKLDLMKWSLLEEDTTYFPVLSPAMDNERLPKYVEAINTLQEEFSTRFQTGDDQFFKRHFF